MKKGKVARGRIVDPPRSCFVGRRAEYSRKAEDILWRKSFYDVILLMRKNLKYIRPNSGLEGSVRTHIVAANGIYHGLLLKLQAQLDVVKVGGGGRRVRVRVRVREREEERRLVLL